MRGAEDIEKVDQQLEAEELRVQMMERELADQQEAFERTLTEERNAKVQQRIEFEEREQQLKQQMEQHAYALELENARLERENEDRNTKIEKARERQQMREEMREEMQQELKCEREARVNDLKEVCMQSQDRQKDSDVEEFELQSSGLPISDYTVDLLAELAGIIPL